MKQMGIIAASCIMISSALLVAGTDAMAESPALGVGWRNDGSGRFPGATPPTEWSQKVKDDGSVESQNILWKVPLPFEGASSPIVVGDRIFFTGCYNHSDGDQFPLDLICVSTAGKVLWLKTHTLYDAAPEADRKSVKDQVEPLVAKISQINDELVRQINSQGAKTLTVAHPSQLKVFDAKLINARRETAKQINKLMAGVNEKTYARQGRNDYGWASPTVCSDGKFVYVYFSTRIAACYDLEGKARWIALVPTERLSNTEHGTHGSPLLYGDKFIVPYAKLAMAIDTATGKLLWSTEIQYAWGIGYSSLVFGQVGKEPVAVAAHGQGIRLSDGKVLWSRFKEYEGENTSAITEGDTIYTYERSGIHALRMPADEGGKLTNLTWFKTPKNEPLPEGAALTYEPKGDRKYQIASPLFVDGLLYCVSDQGILTVFDPAAGQVVYRRILDLKTVNPGLSASPSYANGRVYILDNQGGSVVLKPGRKFEQVAHNEIETKVGEKGRREMFFASPFFSGKCIYVRGEEFLYAIGTK